jgi:hypothetical protein
MSNDAYVYFNIINHVLKIVECSIDIKANYLDVRASTLACTSATRPCLGNSHTYFVFVWVRLSEFIFCAFVCVPMDYLLLLHGVFCMAVPTSELRMPIVCADFQSSSCLGCHVIDRLYCKLWVCHSGFIFIEYRAASAMVAGCAKEGRRCIEREGRPSLQQHDVPRHTTAHWSP